MEFTKENLKKLIKEMVEDGELQIIPVCKTYPYDSGEYRKIDINLDGERIMQIDEQYEY